MTTIDCISRETAMNEFDIQSSYYDAEWGAKRFSTEDVQEILQSIPSANVRPVVHGHWIDMTPINEKTGKRLLIKGPHLKCSECGKMEFFASNFCSKCGAMMKELQEVVEDG